MKFFNSKGGSDSTISFLRVKVPVMGLYSKITRITLLPILSFWLSVIFLVETNVSYPDPRWGPPFIIYKFNEKLLKTDDRTSENIYWLNGLCCSKWSINNFIQSTRTLHLPTRSGIDYDSRSRLRKKGEGDC